MNEDSERYADSIVHDRFGDGFQYCHRNRCYNTVNIQRTSEDNQDRKWRYDAYVVVVSLEDGTNKYAFCSRNCAALWLRSQEN